ncbi:MAG: LOG family protein, partial [Candidatus Microthrix parvicella]
MALGSAIVDAGHRLVFGGGHVGLMGVVADEVLARDGEIIGVMTEQLVGMEVAHQGLTELDVQPTMHRRKARMAELADGVVVLTGGFGTLD